MTGETSNIIIDKWDIQSVQSSQRRVTSELVAKCIDEIENQLGHELCSAPIEEKVHTCFMVLMDRINNSNFTTLSKEQLLNDNEWIKLTINIIL